MARSLHRIQMDFSLAKKQARELDEVAARMDRLAGTQMENTMNRLGRSWTGDNSLKYIKKGKQLQGNIDSTADSLREVAAAIREIAKRIYDAEMEAWEIANNRK